MFSLPSGTEPLSLVLGQSLESNRISGYSLTAGRSSSLRTAPPSECHTVLARLRGSAGHDLKGIDKLIKSKKKVIYQ